MFDCADDVCAYHRDEVTLPKAEQDQMRDRRNANRTRLRKGLEKVSKPAPEEFVKQGSYAMKTMLRHPDNDYDIDDGVYFKKEDLVGERGAEMSSLQARQMVRDALDDDSFKTAPEVRPNCVRIFYEKGYHVDMPVYRKVTNNGETLYELASSSGWKRSDARDVTDWFEDERTESSDGVQLRHLVRLIKKYAKTRSSWCGSILSGFGITVLVVECQLLDAKREDRALYNTMKMIRDRLNDNLVVEHPVTPDDTITNGDDDAKARMLRDKLSQALDCLAPLFEANCTRSQALSCWDNVYNTTYFSERGENEKRTASASTIKPLATSAVILGLEQKTSAAVLSSGGSRHA